MCVWCVCVVCVHACAHVHVHVCLCLPSIYFFNIETTQRYLMNINYNLNSMVWDIHLYSIYFGYGRQISGSLMNSCIEGKKMIWVEKFMLHTWQFSAEPTSVSYKITKY